MLAVTDPAVHTITVMACTQLLKTELINNIIGFHIHQDPSPILVVQPTVKLGQAWSKDRLDKMIRDTPVLREIIPPAKSRDGSNTIDHKSFPGGHITVVGSNSPTDLAARPIKIVLFDETDKFPPSAGQEGDPIKLASERAATFWNSLIVHVCSPTVEGRSRIAIEYELSDQRKYFVPCPHCGHEQVMEWAQVKWPESDPRQAHYHCVECEAMWRDPERLRAIQKGKWRATAEFRGHAGFQVSKLASPWETMGQLAEKFVNSKKNTELLRTFINTQLAETWKEKGDAPEWQLLYNRRSQYPTNQVPSGAVFLTAGVDIQKDRIEAQIIGWGRGKQSWVIDYRVYMGDTSDINDSCWRELDQLLGETWPVEDKKNRIPLRLLAIDSGFNTQIVYSWCRKYPTSRVACIKGQDSLNMITGQPKAVDVTTHGKTYRHGMRVWPIGVSLVKQEIYGFLKQMQPEEGEQLPYGWCHFPELSEEFFKQLTAEQLQVKIVKGYRKYEWHKIYERNEVLDTRVYARAAASICGLDRFTDDHFDRLEADMGLQAVVNKEKVTQQPKKNKIKRRRSNFL